MSCNLHKGTSIERKDMMMPVRSKSLVLLMSIWGMAAVAVAQQQDFSGVKIKTTHVSGPIYMLEGRGGNIGVSVGEDGVLLVDDQYAPLADKILAAIEEIGGKGPKFILNTHWHGDHTGGNEPFGKSSVIIAHTNVRERLSTRQTLFGRTVEPMPRHALPVITFEDSLSVHFNGEEIRVLHMPAGHTDGDSIVIFTDSNVIHAGDLVFAGMFPFVDLDHGGDVEGMARNVGKVIDRVRHMEQHRPGVKIIPGHGPLSTLSNLETYHSMLTESIGLVQKAIAEGRSLEDIKAAGVPERWRTWGDGFIKTDFWLETVHKSLTLDDR
jgi:cyclase